MCVYVRCCHYSTTTYSNFLSFGPPGVTYKESMTASRYPGYPQPPDIFWIIAPEQSLVSTVHASSPVPALTSWWGLDVISKSQAGDLEIRGRVQRRHDKYHETPFFNSITSIIPSFYQSMYRQSSLLRPTMTQTPHLYVSRVLTPRLENLNTVNDQHAQRNESTASQTFPPAANALPKYSRCSSKVQWQLSSEGRY